MRTVPFPVIETIDDVLLAIAGREEFIVARKDGYTVIDYVYALPDSFGCLVKDDEEMRRLSLLRRELRGIKFDASGRLLARAWHKFFNLNEREETQSHAIDWSVPHWVLEKLDGSMVHPAVVHGELVMMTMMGTTSIANDAAAFALGHASIDYRGFCHAMIGIGLLPIFEWCSRKQRIVVDYPQDQLVLTGLRAQRSGEYVAPPKLKDFAAPYGVPTVAIWGENLSDIDAFVAHTRGLLDQEGYVVTFADGRRIKLKAEDYVFRHRAKEHLLHEKDLVALIVDGKADDVLGVLPDVDAEKFQAYVTAFNAGLDETCRKIRDVTAFFRALFAGDAKRFALEVGRLLKPNLRDAVFCSYRGEDPRPQLLNQIKRYTGSGPRLEEMRNLWGGARWQDFYDASAAKEMLDAA